MDLTDVCFAGVAEQARLLATGELSARELVAAYLARIARYDPWLRAYRLVFAERAMAEAALADQRRARGERLPLLGVPVAVKEDQAMAGVPTTVGTDAVTAVAERDAATVAALRAAGAVVLGQTRAPELCLWPYTESGHAGATRNPWSAAHSPGGSSGGSAAAVAAGLAAAALGSDGGGSIRLPASATGVYGLKPQRDRVSLAPKTGVWHGFSVAGPLTRTVGDAALLLEVLRDPLVDLPVPEGGFGVGVEPARLRIGVSLRSWPVGVRVAESVRSGVEASARALADAGHRVVWMDPKLPDPFALVGFAPRYLDAAAQTVREVDEPSRLDRRTRQVAGFGRRIPAGLVAVSARMGARMTEAARKVFTEVDVLLTPTAPRGALRVGEWAGASMPRVLLTAQRYVGFTAVWNVTGQPAAAVPAGWSSAGLPLSVQLVGRCGAEATVLGVSRQLERARPWAGRRPVGFA